MASQKPHAVCVPYPAQGHVTPMLKLAKLLHYHGFHITFVNTEFNHNRLIRSRGPSAVEGLPDFQFKTIPDGLPPSDPDATQHVPSLCDVITNNFLPLFSDLIKRLNTTSGVPPVSCIVGDGVMSFTLAAADEFGIPAITLWTTSAIGYLAYLHYETLIKKGLVPLKDEADITNGYLDTIIDFIPGLAGIRLKDFPSFIRTTDPDDIMLNYLHSEAQNSRNSTTIIINTFDELELETLNTLAPLIPPIHAIGPLSLLSRHIPPNHPLTTVRSSLWKEDSSCIDWLDGKEPNSVVYVNYGSITVMTSEQLLEFAWGLADSKHDFLWVIRSDLVKGDSAALPEEFFTETAGRGLLASWCPQEEVLGHAAVGVFLTHSGWNSTLESISAGVPMLCWPFFAEQQTNCWYASTGWGNGMEIDNDVKRGEVEGLIREVMGGEKGWEMRRKAAELKEGAIRATEKGWEMRRKAAELKEGAIRATEKGGSSYVNFEKVVEEVLRRTE